LPDKLLVIESIPFPVKIQAFPPPLYNSYHLFFIEYIKKHPTAIAFIAKVLCKIIISGG